MDIYNVQAKAYEYIDTVIFKNKKLSHAYLIETNNYGESDIFIKDMLKKILSIDKDQAYINKMSKEVDSDNYPDIKYINPDGYWIKKEQLLSIEREFSKKSMLDNKLIYVINSAEKLNDSSANTILKFLEEPSEGIIAVLVTNNRYKVLETIISRCQIISLKEGNEEFDKNEDIYDFINLFDNNSLIVEFNRLYELLFYDKNKAIESLIKVETVLYQMTNGYIESKYDSNSLIEYLLLINKYKEKLEFNVNIKLWLNSFLVSIMEV